MSSYLAQALFHTKYIHVFMTLLKRYLRVVTPPSNHRDVMLALPKLAYFPDIKWATTWQNQQNECVPSEDIRPVWSESSLCIQWVAKDPSFLHAYSEDCSDWTDAQADLSLRWAHTHFVGFVMSWLRYPLHAYSAVCMVRFSHKAKFPRAMFL